MEYSTNLFDDICFNDLFPDGDFSSILDDVKFGGELNDNNQSGFLSPLPSVNNDDTYSETLNGNPSSELFRFSSDEQRDIVAIVDDRQRMPNSTFDQNPSFINMPISQQTIENQNVLIYYQMYPSIFDTIDASMSIKQEPKANNRIRYDCDGVRFLPGSRYHPLAAYCQNLRSVVLAENQTLGIVMTIVTSTDNPNSQTFVHANDIVYREPDAIKIAYGCVFVPLRQSDINNGVKEFRRLSILYKKYIDYTFDLTPFNTDTMFGITQKYTVINDPNMEQVPKGKCFKRDYDLLSYKLFFQLALKEGNVIYISNITCETEVVHERIRVAYDYNPSETFSDSNSAESNLINGLYKTLKEFNESLNSTESSDLTHNTRNDEQLAINTSHNELLPVVRSHTEKASESSVPLSSRVAITNSNSKQLQLVYPLENTYRARYKSDYFPQNGTVRRPRYIADHASNHFITLQLPSEYQHDAQNDYIRVALITTLIKGHEHYYSPYKFQKDNYDIKVPDENPIYIKVENSRETKSIIRLQLVLIKSKLDQLNYVQPLIRFSETITHVQNIIHEEKLTPKDLINKYQLEKSHLAFTLCTKQPNGLYKPHSETTIISSVISETSIPKKAGEVNSDDMYGDLSLFNPMMEEFLDSLLNSDSVLTENNIAGICESADLVDSINQPVEPNEFDKYLGPTLLSTFSFDCYENLLVTNDLPDFTIDEKKNVKSNKKQIPLSSSVDIGVPKVLLNSSQKIELVYELEETFRPRYKSDYFAQSGKTRKPRYVADRHNNHYISLRVPPGIRGKIRVDWLTIANENGDRYTMPYQFQANNDSSEIPDCNPIFLDIETDSSGIMRLYLVLIKAKQDALKTLQPLQPFHPFQDVLGKIDKPTSEKMSILTPKQLIQKYQLCKSQLAFTLCSLSTDGKSCTTEWDTTVYSTVLKEDAADSSTEKTVACPKCSFLINVNDDCGIDQETITNKRKKLPIKTCKSKTVKKQKSLPDIIYYTD
ncbi:unnamed protein product [Rotaria sp. Silwood2]|nr:unnamed protein product [Rotaria sp. Silwood2]CAF4033476.1 unnamed protein product [Rotaria sp. Silwood2]CAF4115490.1 unnamed protein product [Rotaria sp. Silwood2]